MSLAWYAYVSYGYEVYYRGFKHSLKICPELCGIVFKYFPDLHDNQKHNCIRKYLFSIQLQSLELWHETGPQIFANHKIEKVCKDALLFFGSWWIYT